jgi:hypothetical protein
VTPIDLIVGAGSSLRWLKIAGWSLLLQKDRTDFPSADYSRLTCVSQGMKMIFPDAIVLLQREKTGMLGALKMNLLDVNGQERG